MPEARPHEFVSQRVEGCLLGILAKPKVNVLKLNIKLNAETVSANR